MQPQAYWGSAPGTYPTCQAGVHDPQLEQQQLQQQQLQQQQLQQQQLQMQQMQMQQQQLQQQQLQMQQLQQQQLQLQQLQMQQPQPQVQLLPQPQLQLQPQPQQLQLQLMSQPQLQLMPQPQLQLQPQPQLQLQQQLQQQIIPFPGGVAYPQPEVSAVVAAGTQPHDLATTAAAAVAAAAALTADFDDVPDFDLLQLADGYIDPTEADAVGALCQADADDDFDVPWIFGGAADWPPAVISGWLDTAAAAEAHAAHRFVPSDGGGSSQQSGQTHGWSSGGAPGAVAAPGHAVYPPPAGNAECQPVYYNPEPAAPPQLYDQLWAMYMADACGNPVVPEAAQVYPSCQGHMGYPVPPSGGLPLPPMYGPAHPGPAEEAGAAAAVDPAAVPDLDDAAFEDLTRLRLLHHPRIRELVDAVVSCRKVGLRNREAADALDKARDVALRDLALLRSQAWGPGGMAALPGPDPELDASVDQFIEVCEEYQKELTSLYKDADALLNDFESKLSSALLRCVDATAKVSPPSGAKGSAAAQRIPGVPGVGDLELRSVLKRKYTAQIRQLQEEFSKRKKVAKLPEEATSLLKQWWTTNFVWPYPTEEVKKQLATSTGLNATQINNWFINQRKRHWHKFFNGRQPSSKEEAEQVLRKLKAIP